MKLRSERERAWWLAEEADCAFCSFGYALCTELRCAACDRAVCLACAIVVRVPAETLCPECSRGGAEE